MIAAAHAEALRDILAEVDARPVLVDVGASGGPPEWWAPIAPCSLYLGFDPDRRATSFEPNGDFAACIIHNRAVVAEPGEGEAHLFLTRSPYCSSLLPPDAESLSHYLFDDLFVVTGHRSVPAQTLDEALDELSIDGVSWLKTDTQGIDLRVFRSLSDDRRAGVLAVDLEPGLIDAYRGEDLFTAAHEDMVRNGFWLSQLRIGRATRLRRASLEAPEILELGLAAVPEFAASLRTSPGWCEARYLRTTEHMASRSAREWATLWVFALVDGQVGFAIDLYVAYRRRFGADDVARRMADLLQRINRRFVKTRGTMTSVDSA